MNKMKAGVNEYSSIFIILFPISLEHPLQEKFCFSGFSKLDPGKGGSGNCWSHTQTSGKTGKTQLQVERENLSVILGSDSILVLNTCTWYQNTDIHQVLVKKYPGTCNWHVPVKVLVCDLSTYVSTWSVDPKAVVSLKNLLSYLCHQSV